MFCDNIDIKYLKIVEAKLLNDGQKTFDIVVECSNTESNVVCSNILRSYGVKYRMSESLIYFEINDCYTSWSKMDSLIDICRGIVKEGKKRQLNEDLAEAFKDLMIDWYIPKTSVKEPSPSHVIYQKIRKLYQQPSEGFIFRIIGSDELSKKPQVE